MFSVNSMHVTIITSLNLIMLYLFLKGEEKGKKKGLENEYVSLAHDGWDLWVAAYNLA
jgi:hypothetical protein